MKPKKYTTPLTRADVYALPTKKEGKAVLLFLCDHEPRVYDIDELAGLIGHTRSSTEHGIIGLQRFRPVPLLAREGPQGQRLRGRHAFLPANSELRTAWANVVVPGAAQPEAPPEETTVQPPSEVVDPGEQPAGADAAPSEGHPGRTERKSKKKNKDAGADAAPSEET